MALFRFRWLHKFIRKRTNPIAEDTADLWKRRLAFGYAFIAWNAFGFVCYAVYQGKADWAAYHGLKSSEELALSPAQQWAKTLGKTNAEIYRISGFNIEKLDKVKEDNDTIEDLEDSKLKN